MDSTMDLRISILGELTASRGGEPLDLGGRRQRAVLAVLLLARGEVVAAERLIDCVWGDHASINSAAALQSYVSHLRRSLQPGTPARNRSAVITRQGGGYAVRVAPDTVDAWRFEDLVRRSDTAATPTEATALLREALTLWRGRALAEYADDPWAEAEIARLHELRAVARERLLRAQLGLGEAELVVPELEAMVAEEPLREERWRLLGLALYRAHRQADALAALRRARETLAEELGVDPGPALRELEAGILQQSPSLIPPGQREPSRPPPSSPRPVHETTEAPRRRRDEIVDRDLELRSLEELMGGLAAGQHGLLLVEGPAGIGKTRLLDEARLLAAERSVRVLSGRGSPLETAFGFGVVRQLFEPVTAVTDSGERLLLGAAANARGVFDFSSGPGGEGDGSGRAEGFAVLHGLYWLVVNLTESGPLLLTVDDAQWCDTASLRFLAYLGRRLDRLPVAVVAAVRTGEQHAHDELLTELSLEPSSMVVRPEPLSQEATAWMVERRLGARPAPLFVSACHRTTSGNPLLLGQLLKALVDDSVRPDAAHADMVVAVGSRAVSSMVLLRLRRLPGEVVEVARAAAVLGDGASLPAIAAMSGLSEMRTAESLARLAQLDIVRDEQPLAFVHPLVRDAVYHALPAADRELRHERAATVLRDCGGSDEQVAAHLLLSPSRGDDRVVALLANAARSAVDRGAAESAVTYLRRALSEVPTGGPWRPDLVLRLGMLEAAVDGTAAVAHLGEAYHLHDDPKARADIAIVASATHIFASPPGVATAFARDAEAALPEELVDQRQALIALQRISGFMHGLEDAWRTPAPEVRGDELGAQMLAATVALEALLDRLDRDTAVRMGRLALRKDRLISVEDGLFWVNAAAVLTLCDDDLGDFWSRARTASHARGSVFAALSASLWEGFWQWRRGQLHEALACLRAALDHDRLWGGSRVGEPFVRAFQIGCHLDRGDVAAARRTADGFEDGPGFGEGGRLFLQAVARLLVAEDRCEQALATLDALDAAPMGLRITNPVWNPWRGIRAAALHGCGRALSALELADEEIALLRRWGAPSYLGRALCSRAELGGAGEVEDLREAVDLLARTSAAVDLAKAQCALGCRPEVPDAEAVPLLLEASRIAERHGALAVRDRARAGLERRGQHLDPCGDNGRPLTMTERRILDLSRAGLDAREIAQRLFLTPGTVHAVLDEAPPDALAVSAQVSLKSAR